MHAEIIHDNRSDVLITKTWNTFENRFLWCEAGHNLFFYVGNVFFLRKLIVGRLKIRCGVTIGNVQLPIGMSYKLPKADGSV